MQYKFIEVTNNDMNWGKFLLIRFDEEITYKSAFTGNSLFKEIGWNLKDIIVFDMQTCEGAAFNPGGLPKADLDKHRIFVCPMYEPFLNWLYAQDLTDLSTLPASLNLKDAKFALFGYRRGTNEK